MIIAEIAKFWQKLLICSNLLGKLTVMIYSVDKIVDIVVTTELLQQCILINSNIICYETLFLCLLESF